MRYREFNIDEARRNPELNPRGLTGHKGATHYIDQLHDKGVNLNQIGISMTDLPKLGLNPQSQYNTPIGVYFYPAFYYLEEKLKTSNLPFKDDARYIQIFELPRPILYISNFDQGQYDDCTEKLIELAPKLYGKLGFDSAEEYLNFLRTAMSMSAQKARVPTYGGRLWYLTWRLISRVGNMNESEIEQAQAHSVMWNRIWRELGVATIIDYGSGIIHKNEPSQGVVIDTSRVKLLNIFENPITTSDVEKLEDDWKKGSISDGQYFSLLIKAKNPVYLMRYARLRGRKNRRVERELLNLINIKPKVTSAMVEYARDFYPGVGWEEAEPYIVINGTIDDILEYAKIVRRPLAVSYNHPVFQYPGSIFKYAFATKQRVSPQLEIKLKDDPTYAAQYAKEILKMPAQEAWDWASTKRNKNAK